MLLRRGKVSYPCCKTGKIVIGKDMAEGPIIRYPIQYVEIDWKRLFAKRAQLQRRPDGTFNFLLKPEVLTLLECEKDPMFRLIIDLMWTTGARISEILNLRPNSFVCEAGEYGVVFLPPRAGSGRPTAKSLLSASRRYVPITDPITRDRVQTYVCGSSIKQNEKLFCVARQTVNRHISTLVAGVGSAPFKVSCKTFRNSFAVHLLLHGRPLKLVSRLLGHRSIESTERYASVLLAFADTFMDGVEFH